MIDNDPVTCESCSPDRRQLGGVRGVRGRPADPHLFGVPALRSFWQSGSFRSGYGPAGNPFARDGAQWAPFRPGGRQWSGQYQLFSLRCIQPTGYSRSQALSGTLCALRDGLLPGLAYGADVTGLRRDPRIDSRPGAGRADVAVIPARYPCAAGYAATSRTSGGITESGDLAGG